MNKKYLVASLLLLLVSLGAAQSTAGGRAVDLKTTVLLISIDGFRADYLDGTSAPVLRELARTGVRAKWLVPVFPPKTFPNHYSIVTGLYVENHGVIGNTMYDPEYDVLFTMRKREEVTNGRWWGGEPIWVTAEKQGQRSATLFWPGSEAEISGVRPSYWKVFDGNLPYGDRVNQILEWLDLPQERRPTFLTLYFEAVDNAGHLYGPAYSAVDTAVKKADNALRHLVDGLKNRGIFDDVNLIIVSDHGMTPVSSARSINLDDYLDLTGLRVVDYGVVVSLWSPDDRVEALYAKLKNANPHMSVFRKNEIPERFHYRNHRRVAPLVLLADDGWTITRSGEQNAWRSRDHGGNHGFDNQLPSMRAIFVGHGPEFKSGVVTEPFENVHIYDLIAYILGLKPAPNDGNLNTVRSMLRR